MLLCPSAFEIKYTSQPFCLAMSANECRAMWNDRLHEMPARLAIFFRYLLMSAFCDETALSS